MIKRLRPKVRGAGLDAEVVEAPAEALPFEDSSFDTAVYTLVLCTVPDPVAALAETARILKPGGKLLFVEHVRSKDPGAARWQDRLHGPLAVLRRRLPLQPRHRRHDRGSPVHPRGRLRCRAAGGPAADPGPRCWAAPPFPPDPTHDNDGYVNLGQAAASIASSNSPRLPGVPSGSSPFVPGPSTANDGVPPNPSFSASAVVPWTTAPTRPDSRSWSQRGMSATLAPLAIDFRKSSVT